MKGTAVVVVGGASGIGQATALRLAREGAAVVVADLDEQAAEAVCAEIAQAQGEAISCPVDVSDAQSVGRLADFTMSNFGRVDVLVNTAGVVTNVPVVEMTDSEWHRVLSVNLDGTFYLGRAFAPLMAEKTAGTMIFLASDRGLYGGARGSAYASSKAGVIAFVKSLALELGTYGVTVNAINPGTTDTALARSASSEELMRRRMADDPLGRLSKPEEIAEIVLFLAAVGGRFMTGQVVTTRMRFG